MIKSQYGSIGKLSDTADERGLPIRLPNNILDQHTDTSEQLELCRKHYRDLGRTIVNLQNFRQVVALAEQRPDVLFRIHWVPDENRQVVEMIMVDLPPKGGKTTAKKSDHPNNDHEDDGN